MSTPQVPFEELIDVVCSRDVIGAKELRERVVGSTSDGGMGLWKTGAYY